MSIFFFFNDTATTEIYTLSLHDALPICAGRVPDRTLSSRQARQRGGGPLSAELQAPARGQGYAACRRGRRGCEPRPEGGARRLRLARRSGSARRGRPRLLGGGGHDPLDR